MKIRNNLWLFITVQQVPENLTSDSPPADELRDSSASVDGETVGSPSAAGRVTAGAAASSAAPSRVGHRQASRGKAKRERWTKQGTKILKKEQNVPLVPPLAGAPSLVSLNRPEILTASPGRTCTHGPRAASEKIQHGGLAWKPERKVFRVELPRHGDELPECCRRGWRLTTPPRSNPKRWRL